MKILCTNINSHIFGKVLDSELNNYPNYNNRVFQVHFHDIIATIVHKIFMYFKVTFYKVTSY